MAEIENLRIGNGTIHIVGNQDIVADSWEEGKTYVAGRSYVIREHILYVCNTTHTSVDPFDPTKWTATTIGDALGMAGSANVIECTLAEYTAWKAGGLLINETTYIITDAPNLNATAQNLSYDGGVTSTYDEVESKANESDLFYKTGDTITQTDIGITTVGYVTSGATEFWFTIHLAKKSLDKVSGITINNLKITARTVAGGYMLNDAEVISTAYTVSKSPKGFLIDVNCKINSGTYSVTNNTPVAVYFGAVSITCN